MKFDTIEPKKRRFEETVVFVPFFGGKKENLRRHSEFVSELGFRNVLFENTFPTLKTQHRLLRSRSREWGLKHAWADEIFDVLSAIEGNKILYGFSGPSSAGIEAAVRRHPLDVKAMVFDSGPFFYDRYCNANRLLFERKIENPLARFAVSALHEALWSHNHQKTLANALAKLPKGFPVLSIRPLQDILVPPWAIDAAFRDQTHLNLEILDLADAHHLKGLKEFPELYKPPVQKFLQRVATAL
ncbi:MAG TPA: hypothetical protein VFV50_10455 [Bdellovibrionales bacterium]|nr:hypothetical protein [Bdellovibrionales bacterium]